MRNLMFFALGFMTMASIAITGCGKAKDRGESGFPENFNSLPDTARVAYVMKTASPDSVARFICNASLGKVNGAKIDSLAVATNYAYEKYSGDDIDRFSVEYDTFVASLPLPDKMKMYALAGVEDPQGLGLQLGLEYVQAIRDRNMTVKDVDTEIEAFRRACGSAEDLYQRFLTGFRTVLKVDSGQDVPKAIFEKYGK